jgi:hypothetical protein
MILDDSRLLHVTELFPPLPLRSTRAGIAERTITCVLAMNNNV